jgi:hypothetical protein
MTEQIIDVFKEHLKALRDCRDEVTGQIMISRLMIVRSYALLDKMEAEQELRCRRGRVRQHPYRYRARALYLSWTSCLCRKLKLEHIDGVARPRSATNARALFGTHHAEPARAIIWRRIITASMPLTRST